MWSLVGYVLLYLGIGSALRYLLPYMLGGLVAVGKGGSWPRWEWKYLSAFLLSLIGILVPMLTMEGWFASMAANGPVALMGLGFGGQQISRWVVKYIGELTVDTPPD